MRKQSMPQARQVEQMAGLQWELSPRALDRWQPQLLAAAAAADNATISILDPIGFDPWSEDGGVTAKRIAGALRAIGAKTDVTVNINSPGGDLFEGLAIYSLLREHQGNVLVKVLAMAASSASIVAMAGDEIRIARAGFLMLHDTWVVAMGNRNDLRATADTLEPFDAAMADIYAARSGVNVKTIAKMMDAETFINGISAVEQGFADSLLASDEEPKPDAALRRQAIAAYEMDRWGAHMKVPRSERRKLMQDFKLSVLQSAGLETVVMRDADDNGMRDAAAYLKSLSLT
jgi:ATP-dependent Clp protease protease subunit